MSELLRAAFPGLQTTPFRITSPADPLYNCIAWAAGSDIDWWWPLEDARKTRWPEIVPRELTVAAFVSAFLTLGYTTCPDDAGATRRLLNFLCPESGVWEVGLRRFFVRLPDDK